MQIRMEAKYCNLKLCHPDRSEAQWKDLHFKHPPSAIHLKHHPYPRLVIANSRAASSSFATDSFEHDSE